MTMALFNFGARRIPKESLEDSRGIIYVLCSLSVVTYLVLRFVPLSENETTTRQMLEASQMMSEALDIVGQCRRDKGLVTDELSDPNRTGLIGREFSPLTTSRGDLQAKRTTTNPNMAALLVHLLAQTKVKEGDFIAVGASGSFPGLIIATHAAAKAMRLTPLPIYSIGASQWGANEPAFTWLDMEKCLRDCYWLDIEPVAISLGGENDIGEDWSQEIRSSIESGIADAGSVLFHESNLERNVLARMKLYEQRAGESPIRAFINIGGAWANLGKSPRVLELEPGLVEITALPPKEERGVLFEMVNRGIPVVHLLFVRGLSERYGLSWDPIPLPGPGQDDIYRYARFEDPVFAYVGTLYLVLVVSILAFWLRRTLSRRVAGY